ncbi:MAG: hypothetical protein JO102_04170 [Elusimicrobia bacterium]|nr:hypothetical protein [Elusimicrobiota bacterium]
MKRALWVAAALSLPLVAHATPKPEATEWFTQIDAEHRFAVDFPAKPSARAPFKGTILYTASMTVEGATAEFAASVENVRGRIGEAPTDAQLQAFWTDAVGEIDAATTDVVSTERTTFQGFPALHVETRQTQGKGAHDAIWIVVPPDGFLYSITAGGPDGEAPEYLRDRFWGSFQYLPAP